MKPPSIGSVVEWHQDTYYYPLTNASSPAVSIYLDDADVQNNCLQVIPGCSYGALPNHTQEGYFVGKIVDPVDESEAVSLAGKAGGFFKHCMHPSLNALTDYARRSPSAIAPPARSQSMQVTAQMSLEAPPGWCGAGPRSPRDSHFERLVSSIRGLTLTLDIGRLIAQGYTPAAANPLIEDTSHVHARCASPGRLQSPFRTNTIDFQDLVTRLAASGYPGWYALEYVWIGWEHCNEVDDVSETILRRGALEEAARIAA